MRPISRFASIATVSLLILLTPILAQTSPATAQTSLHSPAFLASADQPATLPSADEVMVQTKQKAAAEHKNILLVFSASWCGPCHLFERFLDDPQTGPIMSKAFVTATLDVGEHPGDKRHSDSPGGEAFMASLGGRNAGYPYIIMLDATGKPIVNSLRPDKASKGNTNIGYPALPVEVDWFMQMLQQAAPSLSPQETGVIRKWLHDRGQN